jgi:hypothetical protein
MDVVGLAWVGGFSRGRGVDKVLGGGGKSEWSVVSKGKGKGKYGDSDSARARARARAKAKAKAKAKARAKAKGKADSLRE